MKNTSMSNPAENFGNIKCYSWSSPRSVNIPSNSIRYNCQKICSWLRRPKTILEIRKKATFLLVINNSIIYKFFKDFTNHRMKTNRVVVFSSRPFPNILKYRNHKRDLPIIWKTRLWDIHSDRYWYYKKRLTLNKLLHNSALGCLSLKWSYWVKALQMNGKVPWKSANNKANNVGHV